MSTIAELPETPEVVSFLRAIARHYEGPARDKLTAAADALSARLTPPAEIVRYCISAVELKGEPVLMIGEGPVGPDDGQWVRYEDHAAALAAERAARMEVEAKAALFDYLAEACSYAYGGDSVSEPSPPEFGISWSWQATTPERPRMLDQLHADAFAYFDRYVNEMDPDDDPTEWDRKVMAHRAALSPSNPGDAASPKPGEGV